MGGMGTKPDLPTSKTVDRQVSSTKEGVKIYNAAVAAKAAQVHPVRNDGASNPGLSKRHLNSDIHPIHALKSEAF